MATSADISTDLKEAVIAFNASDTYACKVASILQVEMEVQGLTVCHITPQDEESVTTAVGKVANVYFLSIIASPELFGLCGSNLHELIKGKMKLKSSSKVLVVKLNMDEELPEGLTKYKIIDYNKVKDFTETVRKVISSWFKKPNPNIDQVFELTMNIRVHLQKIKGVKTNIPDKRRRGPLYYAAKSGHLDLVQSLILLGSDVNIQDKYTGSEACFLIRGKDKGRYAWHYVEVRRNVVHIFTKKTRSGQVDVAKYGTVIKSGWGQDPEQGIVDWINKMYDNRAERPNAPGDMSPLHVAIYRERREVAAFLIENGADINLKDLFGITPFMYCAIRNDLATATLLANKGADLNGRDNEGFTALEIAKMNEHPEMINYIEGINYMNPVQKFLERAVRACERNLSTRRIEELRNKGEDVNRHTIVELRNLQDDVNCLLLDLCSGPVMKPTDAETEATMNTAEAVAATENSDEHVLPSNILCMATAYDHPTPTVEIALGGVEMRTEDINYMDPVQKFVEGAVRACERNLSTRRIEELRQKGEDVKRHAIDELRNLQIKINCLLLELGSFPVMISMEDTETDATVDNDSDDTDEDTCLSAIATASYHHTSRGL